MEKFRDCYHNQRPATPAPRNYHNRLLDKKRFVEFLKKTIGNRERKRVFVQIPEGLKPELFEIVDAVESLGHECVISLEPCYGACDVRDYEASLLNSDVVLHIGHKKFYRDFPTSIPVIYYPLPIDVEIDGNEIGKIKESKIGLLTTVQHEHQLKEIAELLKSLGKEPVIGGSILGCDTRAAKKIENLVDCFLFIGSGRFHATGIETEKPVYLYDVERRKICAVERERKERINLARMEMLRDSKIVLFLISTKKGQLPQPGTVQQLKEKLEQLGKKVYLVALDEVKNDKLLGIKADFLVNFACPRLSEDKFDLPVLNARYVLERVEKLKT